MCVHTKKTVTAISKASAIQLVIELDPDNLWTSPMCEIQAETPTELAYRQTVRARLVPTEVGEA